MSEEIIAPNTRVRIFIAEKGLVIKARIVSPVKRWIAEKMLCSKHRVDSNSIEFL